MTDDTSHPLVDVVQKDNRRRCFHRDRELRDRLVDVVGVVRRVRGVVEPVVLVGLHALLAVVVL